MQLQNYSLDHFFYPKSIAVIGVSESPSSWGKRYITALQNFGYKGKIYAVNNNGDEVLGFKIHRRVIDISDPLDLAVLCIPARFCPAALEDCIQKGIKYAIILSSGFGEMGSEGQILENEIIRISKSGIRIIGPNCFGVYCPSGGITMVPGGSFPKEPGKVALIAQSGSLTEEIIVRCVGEGIRFSKVVSYGNASDINEADLLNYLEEDSDTKVFMSYTEGVKNGRRFFDIARQNANKKPIIVWKVGLTNLGSMAAVSHTGSLVGGNSAWEAFFKQTHSIRVNSSEDMIDTAIGFSCIPAGCGHRIALISGGGAGAVIGCDACENAGLKMPLFSPELTQKLSSILPVVGSSAKNPVDIGTPFPPLTMFRSTLEIVASSNDVDVIVIKRILFSIKLSKFYGGSFAPSFEEQQELLDIPIQIKNKYGKPVIVIMNTELTGVQDTGFEEDRRRIRDYFFAHGIPVYLTESRAFSVIARLNMYRDSNIKWQQQESEKSTAAVTSAHFLADMSKQLNNKILSEIQCKDILKKAGIHVVDTLLAASKEEAVGISNELGYPIAMKIISPQITHKTDIGGVKLDITDSTKAGAAYDEIMQAVNLRMPNATIEGVSVQKMARPGLELIIGMTRDPQFGPMLMFGVGGIFVEILKDVIFRIIPLNREDAREMIHEIKSFQLLQGFRGQTAIDLERLEDLLLKVSSLVENNPEIKEMDINPLIANSDGIYAVDARIVLY